MRRFAVAAVSAVALLGFAAPALAHDPVWQDQHDWQHERLAQRHDNVHDQLQEEHDQAHEQGLSPWEHRQLHEQLQDQHEYADYRIARQHQREHRRDEWQRRDRDRYYPSYSY